MSNHTLVLKLLLDALSSLLVFLSLILFILLYELTASQVFFPTLHMREKKIKFTAK